jgi:tetratricopeptide (TPR) repeat protein
LAHGRTAYSEESVHEPTPTFHSMTRYTRQDVLRILHLQSRHLSAWERAGLIPSLGGPVVTGQEKAYSFEHLAQLRALREIRGKRISIGSICRSVQAMQKVSGMHNALLETSAVHRGSGLVFRYGGALVDPMTRQMAFDFDTVGWQDRARKPGFERHPSPHAPEAASLQEMFLRGVQLEEKATTVAQAERIYEAILERKPDHAPACINLGTIYYNQQAFEQAEQMYRRATEADPQYALAFFDLGNVLDELQRLEDAIEAYSRAIALVPQYADAHYNLALAYERQGERRRALRHWTAYVRLDPVGPWASHARTQMRKSLSQERLAIVSRSGRKVAV